MVAKRRSISVAIFWLTLMFLSWFSLPLNTAAAQQVPPSIAMQRWPASDGQTLVWGEYIKGANPSGTVIYGLNLQSQRMFVVDDTLTDKGEPEVSGNFVIWREPTRPFSVKGVNLETGQKFTVVTAQEEETLYNVSLSGSKVVWLIQIGTQAFMRMRDVATLAAPVDVLVRDLSPDLYNTPTFSQAIITGDYVVWEELPGDRSTANLFTLNLKNKKQITQIAAANSPHLSNGYALAVYNNQLIYASLSDTPPALPPTLYNLATGERRPLVIRENFKGVLSNLTFFGRYLFWQGSEYCCTPGPINGYDLQTDSDFIAIAAPPYGQPVQNPPINDGKQAYWVEYFQGNLAIKSANLRDLLPSARQPPPPAPNPNKLYFPSTGHYLSFGFKNFWQQNGDLPTFGYALTEEYSERNRDNNKFYPVQYFERQRYEYHAENAGTPYEVELARLGTAKAAQLGYTGTAPFQPLPGSAVGSDCTFFAATGHSVCGLFNSYWQSHGLEFGDAGVSYREALALYGYPISQPFFDANVGYMVQYFERARFELHPENAGTPYEVLLSRLGADYLKSNGWIIEQSDLK